MSGAFSHRPLPAAAFAQHSILLFMRRSFSLRHRVTSLGLAFGVFAIDLAAQSHLEGERRFIERSGDGWWYTFYFLIGIFLGAAFFSGADTKSGTRNTNSRAATQAITRTLNSI